MKSNRSYVQLDPAVIEQARQMDLLSYLQCINESWRSAGQADEFGTLRKVQGHRDVLLHLPFGRHRGKMCIRDRFQTVCQGVSQLDVCRSTRFLHVVAGVGDRVELRHFLGSILKDVRDNLHRECRGVDIGITHHEFLQDIGLDSTSHFVQLGTLLQTCVDVEWLVLSLSLIHI